MWTCSHCNETVEENFDVCWNCGTSRDGTVDPTFAAVDETNPDVAAGEDEYASLEDELADCFVCLRCDSRGGYVWVPPSNDVVSAVLLPRLLAVACDHCGYTETYRESRLADHRGKLEQLFQRRAT